MSIGGGYTETMFRSKKTANKLIHRVNRDNTRRRRRGRMRTKHTPWLRNEGKKIGIDFKV